MGSRTKSQSAPRKEPSGEDVARGKRLAIARKAARLAQKTVAETVRVSTVSISSWENGGNIEEENFLALAKLYNVPKGWLRYGEGDLPEAVQRFLGQISEPTYQSTPTLRVPSVHKKRA